MTPLSVNKTIYPPRGKLYQLREGGGSGRWEGLERVGLTDLATAEYVNDCRIIERLICLEKLVLTLTCSKCIVKS